MWKTALRVVLGTIAFFAAALLSMSIPSLRGTWTDWPLPKAFIQAVAYIGLAVLFVHLLQGKLDRRPFRELGFGAPPGRALGQGAVGFLLGGVSVGAVILVMWDLGGLRFDHYLWQEDLPWPLWVWPVAGLFRYLAVGFSEEVFFRGYLFRTVWQRHGLTAGAVVSSVVFGVVHFGNPGYSIWAFLNVFFIAACFLLMVRYYGNLWAAIAFHAAWDWVEFHLMFVPGPGAAHFPAVLQFQSVSGAPVWLTGGTYWPEGSVLVTLAIALVTGYYGLQLWRRGAQPRSGTAAVRAG